MTDEVIDYRFRLRRGNAATWASVNDVLLVGEIGLEKDTGLFKIGDGVTPWNALKYHVSGVVDGMDTIEDGQTLVWDATNARWMTADAVALPEKIAPEFKENGTLVLPDSPTKWLKVLVGGKTGVVPWYEIVESGGDPHWDNVVALLHFDGDWKDETGRLWTQTGDFLTSADNKVFGTESAYFPATGLRGLQTPSTPDLNIGSNDFTVECWINPRIRSRQLNICGLYGWSFGRRSWDFHFDAGYLRFRISPDGSWDATYVAQATMGPDMLNRWTHIAVTREGNVFRMFFDGVVVSQAIHNIWAFGNLTDPFVFGTSGPDLVNSWDGYIDELRITNGVARYTENFTPPTEPFPNF